MIEAKFDMPKLIKSLEAAAKNFGETNKNAVARWGVQTCRALANDTIPRKTKESTGVRKQHKIAIERDLGRVVYVIKRTPLKSRGRVLASVSECVDWMDENRVRNNRTKKLPPAERKECTLAVFNKTVSQIMKNAGIAKGAWLGAGNRIAMKQTGTSRINIGKNFLSYAQKHSGRGDASVTNDLFKPIGKLINKARHSGSNYVLTDGAKAKAVGFGLQQTIRWYRSAARKALDK